MASKKPRRNIQWQQRDDCIAESLFRTPAITEQLLYVSQTWQQPFGSLRRVQERLADLIEAGWVQQHRYRTSSKIGGSFYYQLTLAGYRTWLGDDRARPPTERFFYERSDTRHRHTYALSQYISHLMVVAHRRGFTIEDYWPEGAVSLTHGEETVEPDGYYSLVSPAGRRFPQYLEVDRSTKRCTTKVGYDKTWSKCNRVYDGCQNFAHQERYRVVTVTTQSQRRVNNILGQFGLETSNYNRQLYLGIYLDDFLQEDDALCHPIFADHRRTRVSLVPPSASVLPPSRTPTTLESFTQRAYPSVPVWQAQPLAGPRGL